MTAGYPETDDGESGTTPTQSAGRPGPLPPRTEHPVHGYPSHSSGPIRPPATVPGNPYPAQPPGGAPLGQPTAGYPVVPAQSPAGPPHQPTAAYPVAYPPSPGAVPPPGSAPPGPGYPLSAPPFAQQTPPFAQQAAPRRSRALPVLVAILLILAVVQAAVLVALNGKLDRANRAAKADRAAAAKRFADLDNRDDALEKQAAASLDPQAVAAAVLPSVFKVVADQYSGTAFVIKSDTDGSILLTNYHVVAALYEAAGRTVSLEHDSQRFNAKIIKVSPDDDLAELQTSDKFPALTAVTEDVAQGAPVVVVGAPLGLAQSVTTGVVSAIRSDIPGEGGRTYIQFSAPINPGNSGGPVVNAQKQVVGIASAKAQDAEGIGLAIPISVACKDFSVC